MAKDINAYDNPNFEVVREQRFDKVANGVSGTEFAHFRSRQKCVVQYVSARIASAASLAGGKLNVCLRRNAPSNTSLKTITSLSFLSATSAGSIMELTINSSNTLSSIHDTIVLTTQAQDEGDFDVCYEYQLLGPITVLK